MSNTPNNPLDPSPEEKGPWLYSGASQPTPAYVPPATPPAAPAGDAGTDAVEKPPEKPYALPPLPTTTFANPFARPKSPETTKKTDDGSLASIVDTIEAIIIALILALTFRAFIVEAFVIPTGSMAPTLLGAHVNVICPKCGYVFTRETDLSIQRAGDHFVDLGFHGELTDNRAIPSQSPRVASPYIYCPNCSFPIDPAQLPQRLPPAVIQDDATGPRTFPFAWTNNGDRILVMKYLYSFTDPHRFDVIVFKEPMKGRDNFIKRLIGLPGETVEVINGDVFIGPPGKTAATDRVIARKPAHIQRALWQVVYDNDYYPRDEGEPRDDGSTWRNPWAGAGASAERWDNQTQKTVFHYSADGPGTLQFDARGHYGFNILGYDNDIPELANGSRGRTLMRCTDLRLETEWIPNASTDTSILLAVGQPRNLVGAKWDAQGVQLLHYDPVGQRYSVTETLRGGPGIEAHHAYHVAIDNVDRVTRFFIDGKLILEHETPWTAADALQDMQNQRMEAVSDSNKPVVKIDVGGACELGHLKVLRDLYYTQNPPEYSERVNPPEDPRNLRTANAGNPLTLGPDEFFAMGDNSRRSSDGRLWDSVNPPLDDLGTRRGIVPRRYLLGKAFFVYWPAGFRPDSTDSIPNAANIPLVPNAGDMRLIR